MISGKEWAAAGTAWHVFPNTILLPNQGCIIGYRARPNGKDPDSCLFEMFSLEQIPVADYDKKITDFAPQYFDDYRDADLGEVLTQDLDNSENVTVGMHSPSFDGHRLSTAAGDDHLQPPPRRRPLPLDLTDRLSRTLGCQSRPSRSPEPAIDVLGRIWSGRRPASDRDRPTAVGGATARRWRGRSRGR